MRERLISIIIIAFLIINIAGFMISFNPYIAENYSESEPFTTDLIAGKNTKVGEIRVWNDDEYLYVKYIITATEDGWSLVETHLAVAKDLNDIPHTKRCNPIPGKFPYKTYHDPPTVGYTYVIPLSDIDASVGDELYIAAHAVVQKTTWDLPEEETMYLSDSGLKGSNMDGTNIYRYSLDDVEEKAHLEYITHIPAPEFDQVDALACTPDGTTIYAIDRYSQHIAKIDVATGNWWDLGVISDLPGGVVLAAFSPSGELYIASQDTNILYILDVNTLTLTPLGRVRYLSGDFKFLGADMVFDANGALYVWTNHRDDVQSLGLYVVDLSTMSATYLGAPTEAFFFMGLAIRGSGTGYLTGSMHAEPKDNPNESYIYTMDPDSPGTKFSKYFTYLNGEKYFMGYGDMTVGELAKPIKEETETAWGAGYEFRTACCQCCCKGRGCCIGKGGNWATYFTYTVQPYEEQ